MAGDFEEKYWLVRDENIALKKKKNEQETLIKQLYTQLAINVEALKKTRSADEQDNQEDADAPNTGAGAGVRGRRDLDTEKFVQALKSENAQLRKKNQNLMEKNRALEEKMRQHQLKYHSNPRAPSASATNASLTARRPTATRVNSTPTGTKKKPPAAMTNGIEREPLERQARRVHRGHLSGDLEMALKNRLVVAEKQLVKLQQENEQLRLQTTDRQRPWIRRTSGDNHNNNNNDNSDGEESGGERAVSDIDVEHLRRELRDRKAQVAILNARYENLEANAAAEREIQEQTIEQLEHMNRQIHKLRGQLQDTALENEDLEIRLSKATDLEREVVMLKEQNRKLEDRMTSLCESPFINDAFQRKERIDKMFDLEKMTQEQTKTIGHMTEENHNLHVVVKELQCNVKLMKEAKESAEQHIDRLRQQLLEATNARSLAAVASFPAVTNPPSPHPRQPLPVPVHTAIQPDRCDAASSPLKGEQPSSFPKHSSSAVPMVTRRYLDPNLSGSLVVGSDFDGADGDSIKHLRNRVHVLQLAHLKAIQELERCEKMLHAQTNINKELAQEIEELTTKNVSSSKNLQKRLKQLELSVEEKQQRIQLLEAQNRQLKYAREKLVKAQDAEKRLANLDTSSDDEEDGTDVASVSESLVMAARDLSPGEQLLEIWILGATFDRSVISTNASTFVLCDFYDFESQSTPLLIGHRPEYNFASTYKVTVDAFFLRYLASETLVFELHQAVQGDFRLVGRASVSLASLLRFKGAIKEPELPVKLAFGSEHDTVIGTFNVALRFAAPISEIWKLHLRSYPQDMQLLSRRRLGASTVDPVEDYLFEDGFEDNQLKAVNELQITIFACRGLHSYGKKKIRSGDTWTTLPSSYVHYQILGFPDMFTNIVQSSSSPEFDLHVSKQYFAVEVDACLLQFFSKFQLWLTVFDDHVDSESDHSDGAIGRCGILLEEIIKGESVRGWFQLRDKNDQPAGEISVLIEWKDPFQVAQLYSSSRRVGSSTKTADLHCLDYDQQLAIMRMFAPEMDGRVNYRQFLNYTLPAESLELVTSKIKERLEYAIDTEQIASVEDVFASSDADRHTQVRNGVLKEIRSAELQNRIERFGVFLKDDEYKLLEQEFSGGKISSKDDESPKMHVHYLMQHIDARVSCAERLLLHKIRHTLRTSMRQDMTHKSSLLSPSQPFERYDPAQCGYVSRAEFKRCLGILGFELLDIDKAYKEFVERETRAAGGKAHDAGEVGASSMKPSNQTEQIDLDETTLEKSALPAKSAAITDRTPSSQKETAMKAGGLAVARPIAKTTQVTDARSEFDRRKELFLERMKAVASSSAKSSVYEQLEKRKGERRAQNEQANANEIGKDSSIAERVQQQLVQMHVPKTLHHDAACILQRRFRQHRLRQATATTSPPSTHIPAGSLVEVEQQLSRILKRWTRDELEALETKIVETIDGELPQARKDRTISPKQLGFVISKIPRIAFEPDLLYRLASHFAVTSKSDRTNVAYKPLVHFICTVATEPKSAARPTLPLIQALSQLCVNASHAMEIFAHTGDVQGTGRVTIKRFHEALHRAGVQLSPRDVRVLTVLLSDSQGIEVLYLPLLKILRDSPAATRMRQVISRCARYGISKLRDNLIARVNSNDGMITREQLHSVLMQENAEVTRFEPSDSYSLIDMTKSFCVRTTQGDKNAADVDLNRANVSILNLTQTLERLADGLALPLSDDSLSPYKMAQLQRLAVSSRMLLCPPYGDMLEEFDRFDWRETGLVSLTEFAAVVPRVGFTLFTDKQVNQLAKNFGAKRNGSFGINYRQFLDWTTPTATPTEIASIETKLRRWVADKLSVANKISHVLATWRDAFASVDKLSSGFVSHGEFAKVSLEILGLPLNAEELRTVLFSYDRNMDDSVDYGSFVQLNWKDTSRHAKIQPTKQAQLEQSASSLQDILANLRSSLHKKNVTLEDVSGVVADTLGHRDDAETVDITLFIVCLKQLGVIITPVDAEAVFKTHSQPSRNKGSARLNFVQFLERTLGIPSSRSDVKQPGSQLSTEDDECLKMALASALKYSRKDFQEARAHLTEFCVLYDYECIPTRKLWKHMERHGLVSLLSMKGASLLIQKFSGRGDAKGTNRGDGNTSMVSLRSVSKFLHDALQHNPTVNDLGEDKQSLSEDASPLETALLVLRQLVHAGDASDSGLREAFERVDSRYSGVVTALDFKSILLKSGLDKFVRQSELVMPSEALIGVLVREFRGAETHGGVTYGVMLARVSCIEPVHPLQGWLFSFVEGLRSRIRLRAGMEGSLSAELDLHELCRSLDAVFAHFDLEKKGFLTEREVAVGLQALKYELTIDQVVHFTKSAGVFRHSSGSGGLSRMEFDSFVVDPSASLLLRRIADLIYQPSAQNRRIPRVAELSRVLIESDQPNGHGVLPESTAIAAIDKVLDENRLSARDKWRLRVLFDVNRDGMFAYRLFMKVMSQWQAPTPTGLHNRVASLEVRHTPEPARASEARSASQLKESRRVSFVRATPTFQCSPDDVLRALYNQLSSIDFDSQLDIFAEYLRRVERGGGDSVSTADFEEMMTQIRLKLSKEGLACLHDAYRGKRSTDIDHHAVLKAIRRIHKEQEDDA